MHILFFFYIFFSLAKSKVGTLLSASESRPPFNFAYSFFLNQVFLQ